MAETSRYQREHRRARPSLGTALRATVLAAAAWSCSVDVARDLAESEANRVIVALNQNGVAATKDVDQDNEGRFVVRIAESELGPAVNTLEQEGLPSKEPPGVLDALGESGLVASRQSEHARLIVGTAGELERSLKDVSGVLSARVHLAVSEPDPLSSPENRVPASASVLVRHHGATPPLMTTDVQRLVAGAVPGLSADRVAVVLLPVSQSPEQPEATLARFGPLSVSRASVASLRWVVGIVAAINLSMLAALLFLYVRLRSAKLRAPNQESA